METTNPAGLRAALLAGVTNRATTDEFDLHAELRAILAPLGLTPEDTGGSISFDRLDPLIPSSIRLGAASALALMQQSVVAAAIWRERTGVGQDISVDLGQAIRRLAPASERRWELINGYPAATADKSISFLVHPQPTGDGRHVVAANVYPALKSQMLEALDCADTPTALRRALTHHTADELEQMGEAGGFVMAKVRSVQEFVEEPVFEHLASKPLIEIERIGDSEPEPFDPFGLAPLSGIRALGMGHVIAGAGIGRSLASLGADVLQVWRATEWEQDALVATANVGARSTRLDVRAPEGQQQLHELLRGADVFFANRRPGLLDSIGMSVDDAIAQRPGLVYVTVSTHGETGPWANRIGFDQPAGAVTGMLAAEGTLEDPNLVAWLAATGAMEALRRRARDGGSYKVHISLDRASMWILSLGTLDKNYVRDTVGRGETHQLIDPQLFRTVTPAGLYQGVTEQVTLSRTPHHYTNVLSPRGADAPVWLPKPGPLQGGSFAGTPRPTS